MALVTSLNPAASKRERRKTPRAEAAPDRRGPMRPGKLVPTRARLRGRLVAHTFMAADIVLVLSCALAAWSIAPTNANPSVFFAAPLVLIGGLFVFRAYAFGRHETLAQHLGRLAAATVAAAAVTALALYPFAPYPDFRAAIGTWAPLTFAILGALHIFWWSCVRGWRESGRLTPNIVVVGATGAAERLVAQALKQRDANILGVFDDRKGRSPGSVRGVPTLGDTGALIAHRIMPFVDRIVITVPSQARERVGELIARLRVLPNEIVLLLDGEDEAYESAAISRIADVPLAHISGPPSDETRAAVKRAQDLVVGTVALIICAPLMLLIWLAVRLDSPGPGLFRQRRHGFNNEEIVIWKFRSMRTDCADPTASRQVEADDKRVTRMGRLIRGSRLDELPQLINVLKGEMSLVGPRPHAVGMRTGEVESARLVQEYAHRHRMKPGLTGWAAIHGSRGPVDTPELVRRRVALDVEYIERQSFWLDIYILAMTLPCLLGDRDGVR